MYTNQTWFQEVSCLSELVLHTDVNMYIFLPIVLYILLYVALSHYILFCICFPFHLHVAFYIVPIVQWEVPPKLRRLRCRLLAALSSFSFICILSTFVSVQILHPLLSQHLSNIVSIFLPPLLKYLLWTSPAINSRFFQPPSGHSSKSTNMQLPQMRSSDTNVLNVHCAVFSTNEVSQSFTHSHST